MSGLTGEAEAFVEVLMFDNPRYSEQALRHTFAAIEREARAPLEARIAALEAALRELRTAANVRYTTGRIAKSGLDRAIRHADAALAQPAPAEEVGRG